MNGEKTWRQIFSNLSNCSVEIATIPSNNRKPVWFEAYIENDKLYVGNANIHNPSSNLSQLRKINKQDFLTVYSYYHRWANGETNLRQEVRLLSRNTAYIFALISKFER